jgi:hypothetical protein
VAGPGQQHLYEVGGMMQVLVNHVAYFGLGVVLGTAVHFLMGFL